MRGLRDLATLLVAASIFAAWELVDHLWLMHLDMVTHHVAALLVETCLALLAIFWATRWSNRAREEQRRAERVTTTVSEAMASDGGPLADLHGALREMGTLAAEMPEMVQLIARAEKDVHRVSAIGRGVTRILAPSKAE